MRRRRLSLAGQLLGLQAVVVLLVVLGATPVTLAQNDVAFRRTEGRQVLATAEAIATTPVLQSGLASGGDAGVPGEAERSRVTSGSSYVVVTDAGGRVVYSSLDPAAVGAVVTRPGAGRSWVGVSELGDGDSAVEARVPVQAVDDAGPVAVGDVVGYVLVGREYPTTWQRLGAAAPVLVIYVLVGSLVGLLGSVLLSRRIKRQTHGLEPNEIAGLVEHREAMLHGLREGVVGVDSSGRVTLANDEAERLLGLDAERSVGLDVAALGLPDPVPAVLSGAAPASDLPVAAGGRMLVLNQMPVVRHGRRLGHVTTVRDRTELVDLTRQLTLWRDTTDTLRSQAHEFSNRLHTIAGLIELGEYDEVSAFVARHARAGSEWVGRVVDHVADPAVAALLVAKGSRASELGVDLRLDDATGLPALPEDVSADLLTVLGNLVDNAMEALAGEPGRVVVRLVQRRARDDADGRTDRSTDRRADVVEAAVSDEGPGVPADLVDDVFVRGFSTKALDGDARGFGLALVRLVCERRGGSVRLETAPGRTTFLATLPLTAAEVA